MERRWQMVHEAPRRIQAHALDCVEAPSSLLKVPEAPCPDRALPSLWTRITASTLYAPDKTEAPYPPSDQGPLRGFHGTQHKRFPTGTEGLSQPTCRRIGGRTHIWASSGLWVLLQGRRQCLGLVPGRDPGPG